VIKINPSFKKIFYIIFLYEELNYKMVCIHLKYFLSYRFLKTTALFKFIHYSFYSLRIFCKKHNIR